MPRPALPVAKCDMKRDCPRAWVGYVAYDKTTRKIIETRLTCRQHVSVCVAYMMSIPHARIEVRAAK